MSPRNAWLGDGGDTCLLAARTTCEHCGSTAIRRWGRYRGRQRFRCTRCLRTWSASESAYEPTSEQASEPAAKSRHLHFVVATDDDGRAVALLLPRWPTVTCVALALQRFIEPGSHIVLSASVGRGVFRLGAGAAGFR